MCDARMEWFDIFRKHVARGEEVDLLKFNEDYDASICERIAARHGMTFSADQEHDTAFLRKKQENCSRMDLAVFRFENLQGI